MHCHRLHLVSSRPQQAGISIYTLCLLACVASLDAARPVEPEDGTPVPPCATIDIAAPAIRVDVRGRPFTGCSVDLLAGDTRIVYVEDLCHDELLFNLRNSDPFTWELVSWPDGARPGFSPNSTMATLALPRAGRYVVRFTVCPTNDCRLERTGIPANVPLRRAVEEIEIRARDEIPIAPQRYPMLPASARDGTCPLDRALNGNCPADFFDRYCRCQNGGGVADPQWTTVREWDGPEDYDFVEGEVVKCWVSTKDSFVNHDSYDVNLNMRVDPRHRYILSTDPEFADRNVLGVEWERAHYAVRMRPLPGDRISVFGYWINDCGHEPFYTEIHPPVGVAVHRPRPVLLPPDRDLTFELPSGTVSSPVGEGVHVPGIITDVWFNRQSGEITSNCSRTGLHTPSTCDPDCRPDGIGCFEFEGGDCIRSPAPIDRVFEFRIYLPENPRLIEASTEMPRPPVPLYFEDLGNIDINTPGGPAPEITEVTEGNVTYLNVRLDLRDFTGITYARRIAAAWVYPSSSNWGLESIKVLVHAIDVHNDLDPWYTYPYDDGDWRFWIHLNNGAQEWSRLLDGSCNAHGYMAFDPPWQTGAEDPILRRGRGNQDMLRRLGPDVLVFPEERLYFAASSLEKDAILADDPGRLYLSTRTLGRFQRPSSTGKYTLDFEFREGPSPGDPVLSEPARELASFYVERCDATPGIPRPRIDTDGVFWDPATAGSCLVEGISKRMPWTNESDVAGAELGGAVAGVGDVNGDGYDDYLAAGKGASGGATNGRVELHYGFLSAVSSSSVWTLEGETADLFLGRSVAGAGDVNGDGYHDILIGADGFANAAGAAFLWLGSQSGLTQPPDVETADWQASADQAQARFGHAVAGGGDFNNDGFDDAIIGSPDYMNGVDEPRGRVYIYLGSEDGLSEDASWSSQAPLAGGGAPRYGEAVAWAGDVNRDGFDDVLVGAPRYSSGLRSRGAVYLYLGGAGARSETPAWTFLGTQESALLGSSIAGAGDVNRDRFSDVLVGMPGFSPNEFSRGSGAALLFIGNRDGLSADPLWTVTGDTRGGQLGAAVAGVGDLNKDGFDDFALGAPSDARGGSQAGRITVYLGASPLPSMTPSWHLEGSEGNRLGTAVASCGDIDNDDFKDLILGAPGHDHGENDEGQVIVQHGCGPMSLRPLGTRYFRSVGTEEFALYNFYEDDYADNMVMSGQDTPVKQAGVLEDIRRKFNDLRGTSEEPSALVELDELRKHFSADLWEEHFGDVPVGIRGALFIDCGGAEETIDGKGRRWKPDAPFLVTALASVAGIEEPSVNVSLLTDAMVPDAVLRQVRQNSGDILYEIPVPEAEYRVTLYFAELCTDCVGPDLGGVACPDCDRAFDVVVEGQSVASYCPADAAVPPANDGLGATHKASELFFESVQITDESLSIVLLEMNTSNPRIQAIRVEAGDLGRPFLRGDCNDDGTVDISDASCLLNWLFLGGPKPGCLSVADTNGEDGVNITDPTYLLNFLFLGGPPLIPPYPDCGTSILESDQTLGCESPPKNCP